MRGRRAAYLFGAHYAAIAAGSNAAAANATASITAAADIVTSANIVGLMTEPLS